MAQKAKVDQLSFNYVDLSFFVPPDIGKNSLLKHCIFLYNNRLKNLETKNNQTACFIIGLNNIF